MDQVDQVEDLDVEEPTPQPRKPIPRQIKLPKCYENTNLLSWVSKQHGHTIYYSAVNGKLVYRGPESVWNRDLSQDIIHPLPDAASEVSETNEYPTWVIP